MYSGALILGLIRLSGPNVMVRHLDAKPGSASRSGGTLVMSKPIHSQYIIGISHRLLVIRVLRPRLSLFRRRQRPHISMIYPGWYVTKLGTCLNLGTKALRPLTSLYHQLYRQNRQYLHRRLTRLSTVH